MENTARRSSFRTARAQVAEITPRGRATAERRRPRQKGNYLFVQVAKRGGFAPLSLPPSLCRDVLCVVFFTAKQVPDDVKTELLQSIRKFLQVRFLRLVSVPVSMSVSMPK